MKTINKMNEADGWALTDLICEIIDDEMADSDNDSWEPKSVAQKLVDRIGQEAAERLDVMQAIADALDCVPVGTNVKPWAW
jgi:hypothetical protein